MSQQNNSYDKFLEDLVNGLQIAGYVADRLPGVTGHVVDFAGTVVNIVQKSDSLNETPQWKVVIANMVGSASSGLVGTAGMSGTISMTLAAGGATPSGLVVFYKGSYITFRAAKASDDLTKKWTLDALNSEGFINKEEALGDLY